MSRNLGRGFETPEEAALSGWHNVASAQAHVVRVEVLDEDHVDVIVDTVPSHPMRNHTFRAEGRWHDGAEGVE
jgi:hypothetical protein